MILGELWIPCADCRNLEKALEPRDLDAGVFGKQFAINVNWKFIWTTADGLLVRSEELPMKAKECIYEGQTKESFNNKNEHEKL